MRSGRCWMSRPQKRTHSPRIDLPNNPHVPSGFSQLLISSRPEPVLHAHTLFHAHSRRAPTPSLPSRCLLYENDGEYMHEVDEGWGGAPHAHIWCARSAVQWLLVYHCKSRDDGAVTLSAQCRRVRCQEGD
jgi:hypothetical protein